jgi:hypothetical protein
MIGRKIKKASPEPLGKREIERKDRRFIMVTRTFLQKKILLFMAITLIIWLPALPVAYGSIFTSSPPTIDGDASEWTLENSTRIPVTNGFVHLMNDATNLYVLIDVTSDTGGDPPGQDSFWLTFDVNRNSSIDTGDVNFSPVYAGDLSFCYSHYTLSVPVLGECAIMPLGSGAEGFGTSVNDPITPHRIWELQIPRDSNYINATALNSPLRFALRLGSANPLFDVSTPPNFWLDFATTFLSDQMDLEFIRRAENGALRSAVRNYGNVLSNSLPLTTPSGVTSIESSVRVNAFENNGAFTQARIGGYFFSYTDENGKTGDYWATIGIGATPTSQLEAYYFVERCFDTECYQVDDFTMRVIPAVISIGEVHTLSLAYNTSNSSFSFKFDGSPAGTIVPHGTPSGEPSVQFKGIGTRVGHFGPALGTGQGGYVDATFDDVKVNGSSYDDFSSPMIDRTKWQYLEFAREQISDGVYGLALRNYGSVYSNSLNFINAKDVKEFQAELTVTELTDDGAGPMARLTGSFFHDQTVQRGSTGDPTGDVLAMVGIRHNGTGPVGFYAIAKCTTADCNFSNEYEMLYYYEDPNTLGTDLVGKAHRLSIRYDESSNPPKFIFGFDGKLTSPSVQLPQNIGLPNSSLKGISTRVLGSPSAGGYVSAEFANIATVVDTDGDGVPDSVDNCPAVYNPIVAEWVDKDGVKYYNSQPDADHDGYGDACDLCPKVANDGGPCPSTVGAGTAYSTGPLITLKIEYNGPPTFLVPPNCNNVVFNSDPPIPQNCRRIPPYVLTVLEEVDSQGNGTGYGRPGGDWIAAKAGDSWTIVCNLLEIFDESSLKTAGTVNISPTYTFFERDRGLDPAGVCASGDICVDTSKYNLFQGTIPSEQPVSVATTNLQPPLSVQIDIKPGSPLPKTINLGSQGNVPVAILGRSGFDATQVDPATVKMGAADVRVVGKKSTTYQASNSDVNGDGFMDKVVHFDTQSLSLTSDAVEVCLTGLTTKGTAFIGCNRVRIVP